MARSPRTSSRLAKLALVATLTTAACGSFSPAASPHEAVQELNHHVRFGRVGVIADYVTPAERGAFQQRRREWGGAVQVVDNELVALVKDAPGKCHATVRVSWYRPAEGELHQTDITQRWQQSADHWFLVSEERAGGEAGLLGDAPPFAPAKGKPRDTHAPTVRITPGSGAPEPTL